eukprot:9472942-Pyramimonas_sp.AAC.1
MSEHQRRAIVSNLRYQKGNGTKGRICLNDLRVGDVLLKARDRLEPSTELLDVATLESVQLPCL